jgi:hypothetical protein
LVERVVVFFVVVDLGIIKTYVFASLIYI